jgi:hypothetical protein
MIRSPAQPERARQFLALGQVEGRRVEQDQPADPARMARGVGHADHAAPVVHQQRDRSLDAGLLDECVEVVDAPAQRVVVLVFAGLVREAAADVVRRDHPVRIAQAEHEVAVEERPGRIAVQHEDRVAAAFVEQVEAMAVHLAVGAGERVERVLENHGLTTPARASCR